MLMLFIAVAVDDEKRKCGIVLPCLM